MHRDFYRMLLYLQQLKTHVYAKWFLLSSATLFEVNKFVVFYLLSIHYTTLFACTTAFCLHKNLDNTRDGLLQEFQILLYKVKNKENEKEL